MDFQDLKEMEQGDPLVGATAYQENDKCPEWQCPGHLVKRFNCGNETEFLGCNNYPECKFTC